MTNRQKPVVLVTGAASGIGKSTCEVFSSYGYQVIGVDKKNVRGLSYEIIKIDIKRLLDNKKIFEKFYNRVKEHTNGRLDALVNNAALQIIKPIERITKKDWARTLDTNLIVPFFLVQRFLPLLRAAKGSVVNVASIHATLTKPEFIIYAASKSALVSLTRSLALELAPDVRVNAVAPGATDTKMLQDGFGKKSNEMKKLKKFHPIKRIGKPSEIAEVVHFLTTAQANFITGTTINVDGGIGACLHDPSISD